MKQIIDLRPVYPRRRATAGEPWTWNQIRAELQRLHAVTCTGPAGTFRQATAPSKPQRDLLAALMLDPPKKIIEIAPAP